MSNRPLSVDTSAYDDLPISAFIYEPILGEDGRPADYRIVYANKPFARDRREIY